MEPDRAESDEILSKRLVSAICHEIANHFAAVRLQAHLLNGELNPRNLAKASLTIEDLAARSSALLGLVRPILWGAEQSPILTEAQAIAHGLRDELVGHGSGGVKFQFEFAEDLPEVHADAGVMHYLLLLHTLGALEAATTGDQLRIVVEGRDGLVAFVIEESATGAEELLNWSDASLRGRPLCSAIADHVLRHSDGELRISSDGSQFRTEFIVPRASPQKGG